MLMKFPRIYFANEVLPWELHNHILNELTTAEFMVEQANTNDGISHFKDPQEIESFIEDVALCQAATASEYVRKVQILFSKVSMPMISMRMEKLSGETTFF